MNEVVTKAWAVKHDLVVPRYEVWYHTQKSNGETMENFFIVYEGESSARYWNLAQHIAGKLNN